MALRFDNGSFGTRTIRFETGRLAQQAAGLGAARRRGGHAPLGA